MMTRFSECRSISRQRGLSLVEVLVAVLVLSVGLLGLAALQGISLQSSQAAYFRTQATNAAYEVAEFMRANRSWALSNCNDPPDMETIEGIVESQLPGGEIKAEFTDCVGGESRTGELSITVSWQESRLEDVAEMDERETISYTTRI